MNVEVQLLDENDGKRQDARQQAKVGQVARFSARAMASVTQAREREKCAVRVLLGRGPCISLYPWRVI